MNRVKQSSGDRIFNVFNVLFFIAMALLMVYPLWNVLMTSLVSIGEFSRRPIILWPEDLNVLSYQYVFSSPRIINSIVVSLVVTIAGTLYNLVLTTQLSYALTKKDMPGQKAMLILLIITMFFSGGLIPTYLWLKTLGLFNTIWVMFIPTGVSVWNFAIMKSFFGQLPPSLEESAKLDGANDLLIFYKIVVPLSKPLLATFMLFYAVGFWNSWFPALLYVQDRGLQPLALVLRQMVVSNTLPPEMVAARTAQRFGDKQVFLEGVNAAGVVIATLPILAVYPWLQKYFAKGVMIGSIKG